VHEIALREQGEDGSYLVFPSQFTRENLEMPDPRARTVRFTFAGPLLNIYATLAVRLSASGLFVKKGMRKNVAIYSAVPEGECGVAARELEEGKGELVLFHDDRTSMEMRFHFENFVHAHLRRRALPDTIVLERTFACPICRTPVSQLVVEARRGKNLDWTICNVCTDDPPPRISLREPKEMIAGTGAARVPEMERAADSERKRATALSVLHGKAEVRDYDVFISYGSGDREEVVAIAEQLKAHGILPWLDVWDLPPGAKWTQALQEQISLIRASAVFVGKSEVAPWQQEEIDAILQESVRRQCSIIPVILQTASGVPRLPLFLKNRMWVDFRNPDPDPLQRLIWGITEARRGQGLLSV